MGNKERKSYSYSWCCFFLLISVGVNVWFVSKSVEWKKQKVRWSEGAAAEAEGVASISCSGNGRAYLDGVIVEGKPVCECNTCYSGPDCSIFSPHCPADAYSGDPLFLEEFWMQHSESSAIVISGWHRMSYTFPDSSFISPILENHIRKLHKVARNAITQGKHILFGCGSTQLINAAVYALSINLSSPASVVAATPFYTQYKEQTRFFENKDKFEFKGDAADSAVVKNSTSVIEFVTSPNNPDGYLRQAVIANGTPIHDHAYYWPHFTAIPTPANEDLMIFTLSKLTGHAGSRFGWAVVKDEDVYLKMKEYIEEVEYGISRETQLRALKLIRAIVEREGDEREIFNYAYHKMSDRWQKLSSIIASSKRFSIQEIPPLYCNFFDKVRGPSPGYAWLKCERKEDRNCLEVLREANIIGRGGEDFGFGSRYVRLSLLKRDDDFNLLLYYLLNFLSNHPTF